MSDQSKTASISTKTAHLLGEHGAFVEKLPGFVVRDAQQRLGAEIEHTLSDKELMMAEAGTGTGKTFAYLVPALESGKKTVVSTGTKALQDQLFEKDLPEVARILGITPKLSLLKGRSNYLCPYRLEKFLNDGRFPSREIPHQLRLIRRWRPTTKDGDIGTCADVPENSRAWIYATSTTDNCLGAECPEYDECYVMKARRKAMESDLVVVNHHLLFADMAVRQSGFGEILPCADAVIFDEAHQIPEVATQFFGRDVTYRRLRQLATDIMAEAGEVAGLAKILLEPVQELEHCLQETSLAFQSIPERGYREQITPPLQKQMDVLQDHLESLGENIAAVADTSVAMESCLERVGDSLATLRDFSSHSQQKYVCWYERSEKGFAIHMTPLEVGSSLAAFREQHEAAWVMLSATLSVAGNFEHFRHRLGMHDGIESCFESPFDYPHNALLYHPPDMPIPNSPAYVEAVVKAASEVLAISKGGAFLLFTSHRALRKAAELLADSEWNLLVQGDLPKGQLLAEFRKDGNAVLLGTASFWEGVDVGGDALRLVVIDKLPFSPPDDPVLKARIRALEEEGGSGFMDYQLPQAVLTLKQGVGRLIRGENDYGVVMLCDPRLMTKGYGRTFIQSLPPMSKTRKLDVIQRFYELKRPGQSKETP